MQDADVLKISCVPMHVELTVLHRALENVFLRWISCYVFFTTI